MYGRRVCTADCSSFLLPLTPYPCDETKLFCCSRVAPETAGPLPKSVPMSTILKNIYIHKETMQENKKVLELELETIYKDLGGLSEKYYR